MGCQKQFIFLVLNKNYKRKIMKNTELVTKNNHYYPKFLIRNWANKDDKVWLNDIKSNTKKLTPYDNHLFEKRVYDNDTETQTSKDDSELAKLVHILKIIFL